MNTLASKVRALAVVSALYSAVAVAQTTSVPAAVTIYDRAAKAYSAQNSVDAQFDQKVTNPLLGKTAMSHGRFVQRKPNLISIEFTDPVGDRIVGDGKALWVYLPSSTPGQVLKLPANSDGAIIVDMLGQLLDAPKQSFTITGGEAVTVDNASTKRVQLVPRVANSVPFSKRHFGLMIADARPRRIQIVDGQGVDRTLTMTTWEINTAIDSKVFKFSPPKGVKVVTKLPQ